MNDYQKSENLQKILFALCICVLGMILGALAITAVVMSEKPQHQLKDITQITHYQPTNT